jgi:hypothetical protein
MPLNELFAAQRLTFYYKIAGIRCQPTQRILADTDITARIDRMRSARPYRFYNLQPVSIRMLERWLKLPITTLLNLALQAP